MLSNVVVASHMWLYINAIVMEKLNFKKFKFEDPYVPGGQPD